MLQFATYKTRWISCQTLGRSRQLLNTRIIHNIDSHIWRPPYPTLRNTVSVDSTGRDFSITPVTSAYKLYGLTNNKSQAFLPFLMSHKIQMSKLMRLWYLAHRLQAKSYASLRIRSVSPEPSLFAHVKFGSRQRVWPKFRYLAPHVRLKNESTKGKRY